MTFNFNIDEPDDGVVDVNPLSTPFIFEPVGRPVNKPKLRFACVCN